MCLEKAQEPSSGTATLAPLVCPRWLPSTETVSPSRSTRTCAATTSSSRKEGQPCSRDSCRKDANVRLRGATNSSLPGKGKG